MSFPFKPKKNPPDKKTPQGQKQASILTLSFVALIVGAGNVMAEGITYGHAEISVGFPNGHVTVGKTWESDDEQVVVNDPDYEDDRDEEEEEYEDDEFEAEKRVIITKGKKCHPKKVIVVNRPRCDSRVVVIRPPNPRVVVIRSPDRRIVRHHHHSNCGHNRNRQIIINHRDYHGGNHHGWNHQNWNHHSNGGNHGGNTGNHGGHRIDNHQSGGKDLFGNKSNRPTRERGVSKN